MEHHIRPHTPRTPRPRRTWAFVALLSACQAYEAAPLDLDSHRERFLARSLTSLEVSDVVGGVELSEPRPSAAYDLSDGISLAEAEAIALVFNADLRVARLQAGVTLASAENAGAWEDPTLGVDLTRILESIPEPWKAFGSIGLTLPISGRLGLEQDLASAQHSTDLARLAEREWRLRMDVRRAWTELSAIEVRRPVLLAFVARINQVLEVVERMEQVGQLSRMEARLFRVERATQQYELDQLVLLGREASLRLVQLMGLSPATEAPFSIDGVGGQALLAVTGPDITGAAPIRRESPALFVAAVEYEAAEAELELEIRRQYPDLGFGPGYGREDEQDQILLGLELPLPFWNKNRRAIAEARARRDVARASVEATLERLTAAWMATWVLYEGASRQLNVLESELLPLVDAQFDDASRAAQLGDVDAFVLLDSLARQRDMALRFVGAKREQALHAITLDELSGPTIEATAKSEPPTDTPQH